jgi:hypothetical protein
LWDLRLRGSKRRRGGAQAAGWLTAALAPALCARTQVDQLKEEIGVKDLALVKEHFDHMKARGGRRV